MNIEDAYVGMKVVYNISHKAEERGIVTSINDKYIFVRFLGDIGSKATPPFLLEGV